MAERQKARTQAEVAAELKEAQSTKGDNYVTMQAYIAPNAYGNIKVRQSAVDYFKITQTVATDALQWLPRQRKAGGGKAVRNTNEGVANSSGVPHGKLIKIPTNPEKRPTRKIPALIGPLSGARGKAEVDRKFFHFRVPHAMSLNAIAVMINNQFKENTPKYVVLASGKKYFINTNYKDASKLASTGVTSGKAAEDLPEIKTPVPGDTAKAN